MTRRGNSEGSIKQRADGRWEARVSLPDGTRKSLYAKTRKDVQGKLKATLRNIDKGLDVRADLTTVGQFLDRWLTEVALHTVRPKTYQS